MDLNYLKSKGIYLLTAVVSVFLVIYICFQMKITADDEIYMSIVDKNKITDYMYLDGYLFFDDEQIQAGESEGGLFLPSIPAGQYVSKGQTVGYIYPSTSLESIENVAKVKRINSKIAILQECMSANQGVISSKEYDRELKNAYEGIVEASRDGNLFKSRNGVNYWLLAQGKKNIAIQIVKDYKSQIEELESQRDEIIRSLGEGLRVTANGSGKYYPDSDGYSKFFTIELAQGGEYDRFSSLFKNAEYLINSSLEGTNCGRIVYTSRWYFAAEVSKEQAEKLVQGRSYEVSLDRESNDGLKLSFVYDRTVKNTKGDKMIAVFYCSGIPVGFRGHRYQMAKITLSVYEGLLVPTSSVRYKDGEIGVYIAKGNKAEYRLVKIIAEANGNYVVMPSGDFLETQEEYTEKDRYLARYDTLITSGKELYDGKYIDMSEHQS